MNKEHLRTGDKATCLFHFIKNPEYIHTDSRMVFREGRTKAIGTITKVYPYIPSSGSARVASIGATPTAMPKKKPSQVPKIIGGVARSKGRRGRGNKVRAYQEKMSVESVSPLVIPDHKP